MTHNLRKNRTISTAVLSAFVVMAGSAISPSVQAGLGVPPKSFEGFRQVGHSASENSARYRTRNDTIRNNLNTYQKQVHGVAEERVVRGIREGTLERALELKAARERQRTFRNERQVGVPLHCLALLTNGTEIPDRYRDCLAEKNQHNFDKKKLNHAERAIRYQAPVSDNQKIRAENRKTERVQLKGSAYLSPKNAEKRAEAEALESTGEL